MNADEWDALSPEARRYLTTPDRSCVRCRHPVAPLGRVGEDDHWVVVETPLRMTVEREGTDAFVDNTVEVRVERNAGIVLCSALPR